MQWVDDVGGIVRAVSEGRIQAKVSDYAYQRQKDLESGALRKVGVNCYVESNEEKPQVELHPYDEVGANAQVERLRQIRAERDNNAVGHCLRALHEDALANRNVMPAILEAVKAYATVGEITDTLIGVYGRFVEPTRF